MVKDYFRLLCCTCLLLLAASAVSAQRTRSITPQLLQTIRKGYQGNAADKAVQKELADTALNIVAVNPACLSKLDTQFPIRVRTKGITNQKNSGRCWLFSTLNILRAEMIERYDMPAFEFSQAYSFFWDMLEKANMFFEEAILFRGQDMLDESNLWLFGKPLTDGGQFTNAANILKKYGVVPKEAMPETYTSMNDAQLLTLMKSKLREYGLKLRQPHLTPAQMDGIKTEGLTQVYRLLSLLLGEPPAQFTWTRRNSRGEAVDTRSYTPQSFYATYVRHDLAADYVMFMNDPTRPYHQVYEVQLKRNCYEGQSWRYVNLPMDELRRIAVASLRGNSMLYFSSDVDKYRLRDKGLLDLHCMDYASLLGIPFPMDKKERIESDDSFSDHAMAICGVHLDASGKPDSWLVENSFGSLGKEGYIVMTDEWFGEYTFRLTAEKKYVPADILKLLSQKSVPVPPWNPTF
jgi:bleomycin hydrolase